MRILIVEDETTVNKTLSEGLNEFNYQTDSAENFKDGDYYLDIRNYDLILADWMLPDGNGLELIQKAKTNNPKTAVIILSARDDKESEIEALEAGADDYIKKPFDFDILIARIKARLRFGGSNVIEIDDLSINPQEEKVVYKGKEIELKGKPFEVLTHLARHRDEIVSKEQLLDAIWEEPELVTPNVIEVAINQIRQKMDKPLGIQTIETVRRRGYRFCYPQKNNEE
ncbi:MULTISPECIES: homeostatic response regulator transcription factor HsrA [Hydrogenimonas]|jgi:two-component system OmpR family response regulator|uniref:homeostatic response regulator transcription factor HsrA n=1 Tax=Hydrogenimonas TaxID=223785 RepID=UPI0019153B6F|nr:MULTISPECIES: homeostatic response regulator transcription factor HsrA [Hydrogenimonas]